MSRIPGSRAKTELVDRYINTAYDTVKVVADNIGSVIAATEIVEHIEIVSTVATNIGSVNVVADGLLDTTKLPVVLDNLPAIIKSAESVPLIEEAISDAAEVRTLAIEVQANSALVKADVLLTSADVASTNSAEMAATTSATNAANSETSALESKNVVVQTGVEVEAAKAQCITSASEAINSAIQTNADVATVTAQANQVAVDKAAVALIFDQFDDRYLGAKDTPPLTDNGGEPLKAGAVYYNTPTSDLRFYSGVFWEIPSELSTAAANAALVSQIAAALSESNAKTSETNAANSENTAVSAKDVTLTKAAEALSAADVATTQAEVSSTNAGVATTKATEASTSASNASASESAASSSEANAGTSETNAGVSADAATTQAGIATSKASEAGASASVATQAETNINEVIAGFTDEIATRNFVSVEIQKHVEAVDPHPQYLTVSEIPVLLSKSIGNINNPLLDMPLNNSLNMKQGVGGGEFTRLSTKTYIDIMGTLQTAAIDEPCFESKGFRNSVESTNLALYSDDHTHWLTNINITKSVDLSVKNKYDIDGMVKVVNNTATIERITNTSANPILSPVNGGRYTASCFIKTGTFSTIRFRFYDSAGFAGDTRVNASTESIVGGYITDESNLTIDRLSNGIKRVSFTFPYTRSNTNLVCEVYTASDIGGNPVIGDYIYIDGFQFEELSFATSYIQTSSSPVTRAPDILGIYSKNNMPNILDPITVMLDIEVIGSTKTYTPSFNSGDLGLKVSAAVPNDGYGYTRKSPSSHTAKLILPAAKFRYGATYNPLTSTLRMYFDGVMVSEYTSAETSDARQALIRLMDGVEGWITNVRIWDSVLTDIEMGIA